MTDFTQLRVTPLVTKEHIFLFGLKAYMESTWNLFLPTPSEVLGL